jgi:hypothetical protein
MKTKLILIAFTALLLINGCKPLERTTYVDRWHETVKTDSIYQFLQDTMYLRYQGDTTIIHHLKTKIEYKFKYISKTDTVSEKSTDYKTIIKKETEYKTNWFGKFDFFIIPVLLIYLIYSLYKKFMV